MMSELSLNISINTLNKNGLNVSVKKTDVRAEWVKKTSSNYMLPSKNSFQIQ